MKTNINTDRIHPASGSLRHFRRVGTALPAILFAASLLFLPAGCAKDPAENGDVPAGNTVPVTLTLSVEEATSFGTDDASGSLGGGSDAGESAASRAPEAGSRAIGTTPSAGPRVIASERSKAMLVELVEEPVTQNTRATTAYDEYAIKNFHVFQFNGNLRNSPLIYLKYYSSYTPGMQIDLLAGTDNRVVILTNTGGAGFGMTVSTSTYGNLSDYVSQADNESNIFAQGIYTVMCGNSAQTIAGGDAINIDLKRSVAKVRFQVKNGNVSADSWSVQLRNVPDKMLWQTSSLTSPLPVRTTADLTFIDRAPQSVTDMRGDAWSEFVWYLPMNRAGTNADCTTAYMRTTEKAPQGASYVEITGSDTYLQRTYKIYLGQNLTTDFNVEPNALYTYRVTLYADPDNLDPRVTKTPVGMIDYTTNGSSWFGVETKNRADKNNTLGWEASKVLCTDGWRLPSLKELLLIRVYEGEDVMKMSKGCFYWSSDESSDGKVWAVSYQYGQVLPASKTETKIGVRCVKDLPDRPVKYPYVESGNNNIIVSRDEIGGALLRLLHDKWVDATVPHHNGNDANSTSARFEVYNRDHSTSVAWAAAEVECTKLGTGWRVPTQRELILVYLLNDKLANPLSGTGTYWAATANSYRPDTEAWTLDFATGSVQASNKTGAADLKSLRCVRDLDIYKKTYPYVKGSNTIVTYDAAGSMEGVKFHAPWPNGTPVHTRASDLNAVGARFEIAAQDAPNPKTGAPKTMNWFMASGTLHDEYNPHGLRACTDPWRLPTWIELRCMIRLYKETSNVFPGDYNVDDDGFLRWWSATEVNEDWAGAEGFFIREGESWKPTNHEANKMWEPYAVVRCVRDI